MGGKREEGELERRGSCATEGWLLLSRVFGTIRGRESAHRCLARGLLFDWESSGKRGELGEGGRGGTKRAPAMPQI